MTRAPTGRGPAPARVCALTRTRIGRPTCSPLCSLVGWLVCSFILGALPLGSARAASGLVVLLEPSVATAGERRSLTRIREELLAGGFEVALVDPGPGADPISIAGAVQRQRGSVGGEVGEGVAHRILLMGAAEMFLHSVGHRCP